METLATYGHTDRIDPAHVYGNLTDAVDAFRADRLAADRA